MFDSLNFRQRFGTGIFIPLEGSFQEHGKELANRSTNAIAVDLGYHPDQIHIFLGTFDPHGDIRQVAVEVFTKNVVFVLTKPSISFLSPSTVRTFMEDFVWGEQYDSLITDSILDEGITRKSLSVAFLARVLDISEPAANGVFYVEKLGKYLYFNNGCLTAYSAADGLNKWARMWREISPEYLGRYELAACRYWANDMQKITEEINLQATAFSNVPAGFLNKFIQYHTTEFETVNFVMLMVCHYNKTITLGEFENINHGRYELLDTNDSNKVFFRQGRFRYSFLLSGELLDFTDVFSENL